MTDKSAVVSGCEVDANDGGMKAVWNAKYNPIKLQNTCWRATKFDKPLNPNCFIPRVMLSCFISQILKLI
jgi:hypothetical protein